MTRINRYSNEVAPHALNRELDDFDRRLSEIETKQQTLTASVGTGETAIAHGLGRVPREIRFVPLGDARVWKTKAATKQALYLQASAAVDVEIWLEG